MFVLQNVLLRQPKILVYTDQQNVVSEFDHKPFKGMNFSDIPDGYDNIVIDLCSHQESVEQNVVNELKYLMEYNWPKTLNLTFVFMKTSRNLLNFLHFEYNAQFIITSLKETEYNKKLQSSYKPQVQKGDGVIIYVPESPYQPIPMTKPLCQGNNCAASAYMFMQTDRSESPLKFQSFKSLIGYRINFSDPQQVEFLKHMNEYTQYVDLKPESEFRKDYPQQNLVFDKIQKKKSVKQEL